MDDTPVLAVPTNIITGFLGVGKTTAILHLLKSKPQDERWAVLVNEFGELGIDGNFFEGQHAKDGSVYIREVPGGCMCCAAGLPMQIALNQLLTRAKPQRLLIEPTGLGHPKEVLSLLSADHYRDILSVQQCLTLVDARKISDQRYTSHDTFNQQIAVADRIIGNKDDLCSPEDRQKLIDYVARTKGNSTPIEFVQQGQLHSSLLQGLSQSLANTHHHHHDHQAQSVTSVNDQPLPASGFLKVENAGEGYRSIGWRFSSGKTFNYRALNVWVSGLNVERAKGVFITNEGIFAFNVTPDAISEMALDECMESRIEIIGEFEHDHYEESLMGCIEH